MNIDELAKLYDKVKNGYASSDEKRAFELELDIRSWKREYIIEKLENVLIAMHSTNNKNS